MNLRQQLRQLLPQPTSLLHPLPWTRDPKQRWHQRTLKRDSERPAELSCWQTFLSVAWNPQHWPPAQPHQDSGDLPSRGAELRVLGQGLKKKGEFFGAYLSQSSTSQWQGTNPTFSFGKPAAAERLGCPCLHKLQCHPLPQHHKDDLHLSPLYNLASGFLSSAVDLLLCLYAAIWSLVAHPEPTNTEPYLLFEVDQSWSWLPLSIDLRP